MDNLFWKAAVFVAVILAIFIGLSVAVALQLDALAIVIAGLIMLVATLLGGVFAGLSITLSSALSVGLVIVIAGLAAMVALFAGGLIVGAAWGLPSTLTSMMVNFAAIGSVVFAGGFVMWIAIEFIDGRFMRGGRGR